MLSRIGIKIIVLTVCLISFSGCTSYRVSVNGYLGVPGSSISPGSTINVIEDKKADNTILENEIKRKIEKILVNSGRAMANDDSADYYLLFSYGISDGRNISGSTPIYHPGQTAIANTSDESGSSFSMIQTPGYTTYVPYYQTVYTTYLQLKLIDGEIYRKSLDVKTVWLGEAKNTGSNSDLREVMNYLLIPAFKYFGQNTNKAIKENIFENDKRVRDLVAP